MRWERGLMGERGWLMGMSLGKETISLHLLVQIVQ